MECLFCDESLVCNKESCVGNKSLVCGLLYQQSNTRTQHNAGARALSGGRSILLAGLVELVRRCWAQAQRRRSRLCNTHAHSGRLAGASVAVCVSPHALDSSETKRLPAPEASVDSRVVRAAHWQCVQRSRAQTNGRAEHSRPSAVCAARKSARLGHCARVRAFVSNTRTNISVGLVHLTHAHKFASYLQLRPLGRLYYCGNNNSENLNRLLDQILQSKDAHHHLVSVARVDV